MDVYANGFASGDKAAFAIVMDGKKHVYRFTAPEKATINAAELTALLYVLKGLHCNTDVKFHTNSKYVQQMVERDEKGWVREAVSNKELIEDIRTLFPTIKSFVVVFDKDSETLLETKKLSRAALAQAPA